MKNGKLIVLTGPSASGKTTLAADLIQSDRKFTRLVTCTTRGMRPEETQDIDYHFLDRDTFEAGVKAGAFFEWANVYGDHYGSRKADVEATIATGKCAVAVMDAQGASTVKQMMPDAIVIFVRAPIEDMKRRLMKRPGFTQNDIAKRVKELEHELTFSGSADLVVENKDGGLGEAMLGIQQFLRSKAI
jgi:guanylate kinase